MDADTGSENKFSWLVGWPALFKKIPRHIEQWFAVNFPDGQTATRDGSNFNCLPAAKFPSEHWPLLREIWKEETWMFSHKNLALIESTSTPATTQACNSLGWRNWTMPHAFGEILWRWSFALRAISPRTFCASILQSANWTLQIDVTLLHVDGTITTHKEIGLGSLLPSWFQGYLFILPSWQAWALMGLDCIHWILQQNLRIQRQVPEQKLCHKARWFYGMATSRPFTYLEPSIAARSSGASFNMIE